MTCHAMSLEGIVRDWSDPFVTCHAMSWEGIVRDWSDPFVTCRAMSWEGIVRHWSDPFVTCRAMSWEGNCQALGLIHFFLVVPCHGAPRHCQCVRTCGGM